MKPTNLKTVTKSVNSRNENKGKNKKSQQTKVKSIKKKSMNKRNKKSIKKVSVSKENDILIKRFLYNELKSDNERKKALGNAVIIYDPKGLYELLKSMESTETNINKKNILKKDSEYVKKTYFKFIQ